MSNDSKFNDYPDTVLRTNASEDPTDTGQNDPSEETKTKNHEVAGVDIIGKGYDVFGRYAHPSGIKNGVIFTNFDAVEITDAGDKQTLPPYEVQLNSITYEVPSLLSIVEEHTSEESYVKGSEISRFQEELSLKVKMKGKYKYYSGEAKFGFNMTKKEVNKYYYTRFSALMRSYRLALPKNFDILRARLNQNFSSALANIQSALNKQEDPNPAIDSLFDTYGTHFMMEVVMGGKNTYFATVEKSSVSERMEVEVSVKASYNAVFASASISIDASYNSAESTAKVRSETGVETTGGNEAIGPLMLTDKDRYEDWLNSIAADPALIDFTSNSLCPIWELCEDDEAGKNVRERIENRFYELSGEYNTSKLFGRAKHGDAIDVPWGKKEDWNLFITPAKVGSNNVPEVQAEWDYENTTLIYSCKIDNNYDYPDFWQIQAQYEAGTIKGDAEVNFLLLPKYNPENSQVVSVISQQKSNADSSLSIPNEIENVEDWVYLINPFKMTKENRRLIGWDWNFKQEASVSPTAMYISEDYEEESIYVKFEILWVHKDYAHWTGGVGNRPIQLPEEESTTIDDWAIIPSPIRMGAVESSHGPMSFFECTVVVEDGQWVLNGGYLKIAYGLSPLIISYAPGLVECLLINSNIYRQSENDLAYSREFNRKSSE